MTNKFTPGHLTLDKLKQFEGTEIFFWYRGKYRSFIVTAVHNCDCLKINDESHQKCRVNYKGKNYHGKPGEFYLLYNYKKETSNYRWPGFWSNKIQNILDF